MSKAGSNIKALLKSVSTSIRTGNVQDYIEEIQKWSVGEEEPFPEWDLPVGAAFWNRCLDKELNAKPEEVDALASLFDCLVKSFVRKSEDKINYVDRLKVLASTLKFFVSQKRLNLPAIEDLLQEISKSSFQARQNDRSSVKNVCLNFYAFIWNYMRDSQSHFEVLHSFEHASLAIRWLPILGLEQWQNIGQKLGQLSVLFNKNENSSNSSNFSDFFLKLSDSICKVVKQVVMDDSNNGIKVKKPRAANIPAPQFHGMLNVSFVFTRQLVLAGDFSKALRVYRPVTSIAKLYFDTELTTVWKNLLEAFVHICKVIIPGTGASATDEILNSCELFRECRKKILDLEFERAYPKYAFSFMYLFTENIGYVVSHSKPKSGKSLLKQLPLLKCVKFMKEILLAADASVALDCSKSGRIVLEGVTENRKADVQSATLFHLLKAVSQRLADKETVKLDKDGEFKQVAEDAYKTLLAITIRKDLEVEKAAELLNVLIFHTCNIGYAYQKRKDYKEAMFWCKRSVDSYEAFKGTKVDMDLRVNPLSIGLLMADCHKQQGSYMEGLRWLSQWLMMAPQYIDSHAPAYDVYEQIPWTDWSIHWQTLQKEFHQDPSHWKTVVDFLQESDPESLSEELQSRLLRLEMNAYFSGRLLLVRAILIVGQKMEDLGYSEIDTILGRITQCVGLWATGTSETIDYGISAMNKCLETLNTSTISKSKKGRGGEDSLKVYLTVLTLAWKGLCIMKRNQHIAESQLEVLSAQIITENPEKKEKYDGSCAATGFSWLTLEEEMECVTCFSQAAENFYQLSKTEEILKALADSYGPALIQVTSRLIALCLALFGDRLNAIKAWYGLYTISKLYDRKGLVVLAASEILKLLPDLSMDCVKYADKVNQTAIENNLIKHNKAVYYRLDLAKAYACYQLKQYKEGIQYLAKAYKFLSEKDNFDSTHHLMAECDYVLSLYRTVSINQPLEFPAEIPEMLCVMTPAGLAVKGFKLLGGLSREVDITNSGWTDVLHNYYLFSSVRELSTRAMKLLRENGKIRDLKCYITDAIYFFQRLGIVSKSIALLLPLIETDISGRNFYMAQIRIAAVSKILLCGDIPHQNQAPDFSEAKRFAEVSPKVPGLSSINRVETVSNLKWFLEDINATSFHYRTRSPKYLNSLKADCDVINIKTMEMRAPAFFRHPLTCFCYTCSHLDIIPTALEFLQLQAKYAVGMKWKISMAILELTRIHYQRSLFRIIFSMDYVCNQLQTIIPTKSAAKLIHHLYGQSFYMPGMQIQLAEMEICPVDDIKHMINLMNLSLKLADIVDSQDYTLKALPLELGTGALYEYLVSSGQLHIKDSELRDRLQSRVDQQEKENTVIVQESPDVIEATVLASPAVPPPVRKGRAGNPLPPTKQQQHGRKVNVTSVRPRRILNSQAQRQGVASVVELIDLTKVDGLEEERHVPIIPPPNFDDSDQ